MNFEFYYNKHHLETFFFKNQSYVASTLVDYLNGWLIEESVKFVDIVFPFFHDSILFSFSDNYDVTRVEINTDSPIQNFNPIMDRIIVALGDAEQDFLPYSCHSCY